VEQRYGCRVTPQVQQMTNRTSQASTLMSLAVLLVGTLMGESPARAATWKSTAAGTSYSWTLGANWDGAYPNAPGATANFNIDLAGDQTVNLNGAITVGTFNAGDTNGTSSLTIGSGTGGNPLVFQGATAGAPTAINLNTAATSAAGSNLTFNSGIKLGGTSPLSFNMNGTLGADYNATISTLNLNGNTFTVTGPSSTSFLIASTAVLDPGVLTGGGAFVQNGGAVGIQHDIPGFTGSITVNNGSFGIDQFKMSAVSQYAVGGAFQTTGPTVNGNTPGKYPIGGVLHIGNGGWPLVSTLPDRLNHNGAIVFNGGGFLEYSGQGLDPSLGNPVVLEQVKQIRFNPGMSEIRMLVGTNSSGTTLLANDPSNALVRQQGATFMIGGDDANNWVGLGVVEKLKFNSGMASQLKGGGGAAGSQSVSIIPWMNAGTVYHPSQGLFVTYDDANGIRALTAGEYYTGTVYGAPATANVKDSDLNLGTNHAQTINSYTSSSWGNTDIGPGSTLTVSSGLIKLDAQGSIGNGTPANAGTITFGSAEGILWSGWQAYNPNTVGSVIAGSGGLTIAGTNVMILKAANTYTGKTTVGAGILQIGDGTLTTSKLGAGNVEVCAGATLLIKARVTNAIADTADISLDDVGDVFYGMLSLESGINETVHGLILGGTGMPAGTYGSSTSAATYKLDNYFAGSGILTVTAAVPEPATLTLLGTAGLFLLLARRCRRSRSTAGCVSPLPGN
jgi:fibronectin-binding autotransporter adhesin